MNVQEKLTAFKDSLAIVRELALIIALIVLICRPGLVAQWSQAVNKEAEKRGATQLAVNMGFVSMSFDNTKKQISSLGTAIDLNDTAKRNVQLLATAVSTPQLRERVEEIRKNMDSLGSQLHQNISEAKSDLLAQEQFMQDAPGLASGPGSYAIVVSADKKEDLAGYEVQQLKKRGIADVAIYQRQGFLRTVGRFSQREAADKALPTIQSYRKSAYVINLDKWCTQPQALNKSISGAAVLACQ